MWRRFVRLATKDRQCGLLRSGASCLRKVGIRAVNVIRKIGACRDLGSTGFFVVNYKYMIMIYLCPFCGNQLDRSLRDGIGDCTNCHRIFDSCKYNQLLAAAWVLRKNTQVSIEKLIHMTKLSPEDALFVYTFVGENLYNHEEFQAY